MLKRDRQPDGGEEEAHMQTPQSQHYSDDSSVHSLQSPSAAVAAAAAAGSPSPSHAAAASVGSGDESLQAQKRQRVTEEGASSITALPPHHSHTHHHAHSNGGGHGAGVGPASESLEVRLLIESAHCGALIGKGGSNISRVRTSSGAQATILKNDAHPTASERVLQLRGSQPCLALAAAQVLDILHHEVVAPWGSAAAAAAAAAAAGAGGDGAPVSVRPDSLVLLVHQSSVGALIGAGGALIKASQAETGARIHVASECAGGWSTDKLVTLSGSQTAVHAAFVRVLAQLANNPLKLGARTALYVPGMMGVPLGLVHAPAGMMAMYPYGVGGGRGGRGGGTGGATAAAAAATSASGIVPPVPHGGALGSNMAHSHPPSPAMHGGAAGHMGPAGGFPGFPPPLSIPHGSDVSQSYESHGWGGAGGGAGEGGEATAVAPGAGGGPRPPRDRSLDPSCTTQRISIPAVCSGVVLGKGGSIIRSLVQQSGAKISLAAPDPSAPTERVVTIVGAPHQIQAAIALVQQQVESYVPRRQPPSVHDATAQAL